MKLDLDYIKKLLNTMNECNDDRVSLKYLINEFKIDLEEENNISLKKLRHHLSLLYSVGFLDSSSNDLGFLNCLDGALLYNSADTYWPTLQGYQLMESLNNDTLLNKIKTGIKMFGIEALKQIPALAISLLTKG